MTPRERIARPIRIAQELASGALGGTYTEAVLLLTALISGIAAEAWPGTGKDRLRFVELLARHTPATLGATNVSFPLLIRECHLRGHHDAAEKLEELRPEVFGPGQDSRVVTAMDADGSEEEVAAAAGLDRKFVRDWSYAAVLYRRVRCGVAHEYRLDQHVTAWPMTSEAAPVSYSNLLEIDRSRRPSDPHEAGRWPGTGWRQIHFDVSWLSELVFAAFDSTGLAALPEPVRWWADGSA